jgi:type I restriction enzyme M protein
MRFDVVLTNPPFGTKGADQAPDRDEFMVRTSNKQLNFIQHVVTILKPYGRAAIVVPDNCLFEEQANRVFEYLLNDCNLHTLLRLPQGTFSPYSPGVKANVLFFTKGRPTEEVWIYDARTNIPSITKKERPLKDEHFSEFEACFGDDPNCFSVGAIEYREKMAGKIERFKKFHISYIKERGYNLDIFWLKEEGRHEHISEEPETLANDALLHIQTATNKLQAVLRFFSQIGRGTG